MFRAGAPGLPGTLGADQAPNTAQKSFGGGEGLPSLHSDGRLLL